MLVPSLARPLQALHRGGAVVCAVVRASGNPCPLCAGSTIGHDDLDIHFHTSGDSSDPITKGRSTWNGGAYYFTVTATAYSASAISGRAARGFYATGNINAGNSVAVRFVSPTDVFMITHPSWSEPSLTGWAFVGRGRYIHGSYSMEMYWKVFGAGTHTLDSTSAAYIFLHAGICCTAGTAPQGPRPVLPETYTAAPHCPPVDNR